MLTRADLHDYQLNQGVPHIQNNERCALWMPVGAGKSVTTLTALDELSLVEDVWPALVLGPLRVARSVWPNEPKDWEHLQHLTTSTITGTVEQRLAGLRKPAHIYSTNYESLEWLVETLGDDWPFKTVIADEFPKLKSFRIRQGSKRAGALGKVAHKKVRRFIGLTGTPAPNGLKDLWGQLWFLDEGARLGRTYSAFEQRWFRKGYDGFSITPMPHAEAEIHEKIRDLCLTVDVPAADEPLWNNVYVDLPPKARLVYQQMEKEMFAQIEEHGVEAFSAATRTQKCEQIANGAIYYDDRGSWEKIHDAKIEALESIVEESGGAPILCGYQYQHDLERLRKAFPKGKVLDANPKTIEAWNKGEYEILFAHAQSAGHGLNLARGGNILVRAGFSWSWEEFEQILGRVGPRRQAQAGFDRPVFDHRILAKGTIDEDKLDRVMSKKSVEEVLLDAARRRKE
jgi:SNF2 family DNA or RNA helicase